MHARHFRTDSCTDGCANECADHSAERCTDSGPYSRADKRTDAGSR